MLASILPMKLPNAGTVQILVMSYMLTTQALGTDDSIQLLPSHARDLRTRIGPQYPI